MVDNSHCPHQHAVETTREMPEIKIDSGVQSFSFAKL